MLVSLPRAATTGVKDDNKKGQARRAAAHDIEGALAKRVVQLLVNVEEGVVCKKCDSVRLALRRACGRACGAQVMIQRSMQPICKIHRCRLFSHPVSSEMGSSTAPLMLDVAPMASCRRRLFAPVGSVYEKTLVDRSIEGSDRTDAA